MVISLIFEVDVPSRSDSSLAYLESAMRLCMQARQLNLFIVKEKAQTCSLGWPENTLPSNRFSAVGLGEGRLFRMKKCWIGYCTCSLRSTVQKFEAMKVKECYMKFYWLSLKVKGNETIENRKKIDEK